MRGLLEKFAVRLASECINAQARRIDALEHELDIVLDQRDEYLEQLKFSMHSNKRKRGELRLQHELRMDSRRQYIHVNKGTSDDHSSY